DFENSISTIRSLFLVAERKPGSRGFILGHSNGYAFQTGSTTMWNKSWTDPNLLNGTIRENGNWRDGMAQDYGTGSITLTSIVTDGLVRGSNFSRDRDNEIYWRGTFAELLIYNEPLPTNFVRLVEGYLAHKWGLENSLTLSHPYRYNDPVPSDPSANLTIYWGSEDGGENVELWENKEELGLVSVGLRKLGGEEVVVKADPEPNDKGSTYPASKLLDGQLPRDGWRSTWTAWYGVNPQLTFNLGREWPLSKVRIYYQPFARDDELKLIDVYVADDEMNFLHYETVNDFVGPLERGKFIEFSLEGISTQAVRLVPQFQGWGHQWGEVEFWVYDDGLYESDIFNLANNETYFYRTFASNSGGGVWAQESKSFIAEDRISYESGKLFINTSLGTWEHSNGDTRFGEVYERTYFDNSGNSYPFKVCTFDFDQVSLAGSLEVVISGTASLEVKVSKDVFIGTPLLLNGANGGGELPGSPGPGGFNGGKVNERGLGPGGGLSGVSPGGGGHGGAGARSTLNSGKPYGDGQISNLIGGSGGGGYLVDSSGGAGGGAISIAAGKTLKLDSTILVTGGTGAAGSGGGSGGAIRLSATHLTLTENSLLDASGGGSGGGGGRIYLSGSEGFQNFGSDNLLTTGGEGTVSGTEGSVRFDQPIIQANLNYFSGTLLMDTSKGIIKHSSGDLYYGLIEDQTYRHEDGTLWSYSVCKFTFEEIRLGGSLIIELMGNSALLLEAASGDMIIGSDLRANGGNADTNLGTGGLAILGGYQGVSPGMLAGKGPGSTIKTAEQGYGAAHGGHGSGDSTIYGTAEILDLIGGSSGGSSTKDGSGAGGGAIHLRAAGNLQIEPNVVISANGGDGIRSSASGSGGAIRLEAQTIHNLGTVEARAGKGVQLAGTSQIRGSGGGRIAFHAIAEITVGKVDVSGEWLSSDGSVYVGGNYFASSLNLDAGTLTFDTKSGYFSVEGGAHGTGIIGSSSYTDGEGYIWNVPTFTFSFGEVNLGPEVRIILRGDKPMIIQTLAGGNFYTAADFVLDGGDASKENGYGGSGVLNPWHGKSAENLNGDGPGGAPAQSGKGSGASYNYNEKSSSLLPGSSGSSGRLFQGSGAGGGALRISADGDLTIASGALFSASGGNGRTDQDIELGGGGGSGGAIQLFGQNISNKGMIRVLGGNGGTGDGQVLFASPGKIERGVIEAGNGKVLEVHPPTIELDKINYLSYRNAVEKLSRAKVLTRPENLKAHWSMDEDQGFVLFDSTGNHDAILVGEVSRVPGKIGSAIQFDGESGYARSDSTALSLGIEGKNPRTISLWFWLDAYQPNEKAGLYGYGELAPTDETDRFWGIRNISQNNFSSFISDHYGWNFSVSHEIELRNNWNHLAHIYDGANIFIYLNGQQIASETRSLIDTGNVEPFLMGRASSQPSTYFRGKLDDFRIYDDSLNGSEISSITTSEDLISESLNLQLKINTNGEIDELSVEGLPPGLELDPL
ncbi:MAG: discoidin domain-containing protein, partial [Opitutales bacterium]|nr:discoidin domain-containing protein [Opitutales bacterium]